MSLQKDDQALELDLEETDIIRELNLDRSKPLCDICDLLDLEKVFFGDEKYEFPSTQANLMGSWRNHFCWSFPHIKKSTSCLLCRLIYNILLSSPHISLEDLEIISITKKAFYSRERDQPLPGFNALSLRGMRSGIIRMPSELGIWIAPAGNRELRLWNTREACLKHFYPYLPPGMVPMTTDEQHVMFDEWREKTGNQYTVSVRAVQKNELDVGVVTSWLRKCEEEHTEWCSGKPIPDIELPSFRVIDVTTSNITKAPQNCRYLALSYVWGQIQDNDTRLRLLQLNHVELEKPGSLRKHINFLPATVQDAMLLCKKLNERYLWVDSLCIIQDSREEQQEQMSKMDLIYRRALLTIVAAAGEDAYAGLPGLSLPRVNIPGENIQSLDLVVIPQDGEAEINLSKWNTRAWTFQEKLLSTRLLRFTKNLITFECLEACWREDLNLLGEDADKFRLEEHERRNQETRGNFHQIISDERADFEKMVPQEKYSSVFDTIFRGSYSPLVADYTKRQLTNENDILNAFGGIQSALSRSLGKFHWGLPLHTLARSLCWIASSDEMYSRPGFPSYSWAGWVFEQKNDANYKLLVHGPTPGFSTYSDDGAQTYWGSHCMKDDYIGIRPELDSLLFPTSNEKAKEMDKFLSRTLDSFWDREDDIKLSSLIFFWTATVSVRPHYIDEKGKTILDRLDRTATRAAAKDNALSLGGWLEEDEIECLLAHPEPSCIELAYIAFDKSSFSRYACIMIRWTDGIARRIFPQIVFSMDPEEWERQQPQQKFIVLA